MNERPVFAFPGCMAERSSLESTHLHFARHQLVNSLSHSLFPVVHRDTTEPEMPGWMIVSLNSARSLFTRIQSIVVPYGSFVFESQAKSSSLGGNILVVREPLDTSEHDASSVTWRLVKSGGHHPAHRKPNPLGESSRAFRIRSPAACVVTWVRCAAAVSTGTSKAPELARTYVKFGKHAYPGQFYCSTRRIRLHIAD